MPFAAMSAGDRILLAIEVTGWAACLALTLAVAMLGVPYVLFRLWLLLAGV